MNVAGIDEAGRGCIYGPVYAGCVIWDERITHKLLKDSKKLSIRQRNIAYEFIIEHAIDYGIGYATANEIDSMNILNATFLAMHRAIENTSLHIDKLLIDGTQFKEYKNIPYECHIKGDDKFKCISAASILAKVEHDKFIEDNINENLEKYSLKSNKGYCTKAHMDAVKYYGRTEGHRYSFKLPFEKLK